MADDDKQLANQAQHALDTTRRVSKRSGILGAPLYAVVAVLIALLLLVIVGAPEAVLSTVCWAVLIIVGVFAVVAIFPLLTGKGIYLCSERVQELALNLGIWGTEKAPEQRPPVGPALTMDQARALPVAPEHPQIAPPPPHADDDKGGSNA